MYDITLPVTASLALWPGDVPYSYQLGWAMGDDSPVNVGAINTSVHIGTHIDAPFHFEANGQSAGQLDLAPFLGPVVVVEATQHVIGWDIFRTIDFTQTPRVLVKTGAWPDSSEFPAVVPVLAPDVPALFAERGVVLFGIDVPSVDELDSKTMLIHRSLYAARIAILEGVDLKDVPVGVYQLSALPLRLMEADGSPVRAVLWTE